MNLFEGKVNIEKSQSRKRLESFLLIVLMILFIFNFNKSLMQRSIATSGEGPLVTILSPQNKTYTSIVVQLIFTINKEFSWIGYSLDFKQNVTIVGNVTLTGLAEGGHNVVVYANDTSGVMSVSERVYFTVSPVHDVSVKNISLSYSKICAGETVSLNVTVENKGTVSESFNVSIYYNETIIEMKLVQNLSEGLNETLTYHWNTTNVHAGVYMLKAEASVVSGETHVNDNLLIYGPITIYPKPQVQIKPSTLEFKVEQDFTIGVWIFNVTKLCHFEFTLLYDPSLLYISEVLVCDEYGMFLKGPYSGGTINNDAANGKLYVSLTQSVAAIPVSGAGQLAQIKIKIAKTITYSWKPNSTNYLKCAFSLTKLKIGVRLDEMRILEQYRGEISAVSAEYLFKPVPGDLNLDGITDVSDLCGCAKKFGSTGETIFDLNGDGIVEWKDLVLVGKNIGRTKP